MKRLPNPFKKIKTNWKSYIATLIGIAVLILNFKPGYIIMGLDNASPWFDFTSTINLIFHSENYFQYGGMLYSLPFTALRLFTIEPWIISQVFYWTSMWIGLYFITKTLQQKGASFWFLVPLFAISHLAFIWIFSQPTFLFVSSFSGVITLFYLLTTQNKKFSLLETTLLVVGFLYLMMTTINPIAFVSYFLEIYLLALAVDPKSIKRISVKAVLLFTLIVFATQVALCFHQSKTLIWTELNDYFTIHRSSTLANEVTQSLRTAEIRNNSLTNIVRYVGGWTELNDINGAEIFTFRSLYTKNVFFILWGITPIVFIAFAAFKDNNPMLKRILLLLGIVTIVSSSYMLVLLSPFPLVSSAFRWISSKTWPLIYLPVILGLTFSLDYIRSMFKNVKLLFAIIIIASCAYSFPVLSTNLINQYSLVRIPASYITLGKKLTPTDVLIIFPKPQKLFFRWYEWKYYGTDFMRFLTLANVIDGTQINEISEYNKYERCFNNSESDCGKYYILVNKQSNGELVIKNPNCSGIVEKDYYFLFLCE